MFLKPGFEDEYQRRHAAIWPELKKMLSDGGVYDYSIYWDCYTNILFACQKTKARNRRRTWVSTQLYKNGGTIWPTSWR